MRTTREILDDLDSLTEEHTVSSAERVARICADGLWHTPKEISEQTGIGRMQVTRGLQLCTNETRKVKIGQYWQIAYRNSTVKRWAKGKAKG